MVLPVQARPFYERTLNQALTGWLASGPGRNRGFLGQLSDADEAVPTGAPVSLG
jgi:hypothetical protein